MRTVVMITGISLAVSIACSAPSRSDATVSEWNLSDTPTVAIHDSTNPRGHEFNGISSARRLRHGRILVANAGAFELAHYESDGRFIAAVGRKGDGPGEFQGPISVFAWRADSLVVYDPATLRWTVLDSGLTLARTAPVPDSAFLQPTWLYRGAMVVDGVTDQVPVWILSVLDTVRSRDPEYTRLIRAWRDDAGALWIRDSMNARRWEAYTRPGLPAGTMLLPEGFEPLQIGRDFVLGLLQDTLGVEEIRVYALERPDADVARLDLTPAPVPTERTMLQPFRDLLMAQELHYSTHGIYASTIDSLKVEAFPGRLFLIAGDARHWAGVSVQPETGVTCGLSVGWPAPLGWLDGAPFCGR